MIIVPFHILSALNKILVKKTIVGPLSRKTTTHPILTTEYYNYHSQVTGNVFTRLGI